MITLLSTMIAMFLFPIYTFLLKRFNKVQANYKNEQIPISFGLFILFSEWLMMVLLIKKEIFYFWALFFITMIGTYDDFYGDKKIKGFKGHFSAFCKGVITSGFVKAIGGGIVAFLLSLQLAVNPIEITSNALLIVLMQNTMNLFDLRPGRAIKLYLFLFLLLEILNPLFFQNELPLIQIGILFVVFFYDIRAKIMLGDSGANLLGFQLGIWYSLLMPLYGKLFLIFLLFGINLYSERHSISQFIDQHKWLKAIDRLGQKGIG
ncbi:hypothetical protein [Tepidibacillus sp. LV47]|uniref:hypothetical protein n=1 Tax=Tepidibacillus sp. LV47 TaxID=3398228 RepID=UPI003AADE56B